MQKVLNSISIILLSVGLIFLSLMIGKLKKQRDEDRKIINGLGMAVIQLIEKENNNQTY